MESESVNSDYCGSCGKPVDQHLAWCDGAVPWKPKPDHYAKHKIDPWIFCLENELDFATGNVIKYVVRHKDKNGAEDLDKAIRCLQMMKEFYYGEG
jgi:hypothetical protein